MGVLLVCVAMFLANTIDIVCVKMSFFHFGVFGWFPYGSRSTCHDYRCAFTKIPKYLFGACAYPQEQTKEKRKVTMNKLTCQSQSAK